jgi:hypothetical protein
MRAWLLFAPMLVFCSARIDDPNVGAVPDAPDAQGTSSTDVTTFAMSALFLGDMLRDGGLPSSPEIWTHFGYDVDHRTTIAWSPDVCTPTPGALEVTWIDGDDGIDDAFGAGVLPLIAQATSINPSADATQLIAAGTWTLQLRVTGLSGDAHQSALGLSADAFVSGAYGGPVAFDTSTTWPVRASTRAHFDTVYVADGLVVMRDAESPLVLPVQLTGAKKTVTLVLAIRVPIVTFAIGDGTGTIAGVVETEDAARSAKQLAVQVGECGTWFDTFIRGAPDILVDGGNGPGVPCDAISIGLGFIAKQIGTGPETGIDPLPLADTCATDAGIADADAD